MKVESQGADGAVEEPGERETRESALPGRATRLGAGRLAGWYDRRARRRGGIDGRMDRALRWGARVYAWLELPKHAALLGALLVDPPVYWMDAGEARCIGCWHGYRLRLDLSDFFQRRAYFLGRYHELTLQVLMRRALRPGDVFIDGGANNGLVTLVAAWLVGPSGKVLAFEPNPRARRQLRWHTRANRLRQVQILPVGLSDADGEFELAVPGDDNLGAGTFAPLPARYEGCVQARCTARTVRGDDVLAGCDRAMMIKLDVEGFEVRALEGLRRTIERMRPLVHVEMNAEMLGMAGTSPEALCEMMEGLGYIAYDAETRRALVRRRHIVLKRWERGSAMPWDLVWIHPESVHARRLRRWSID